jgi:8-oxo-dGTP pyrophosphatase MutT (NUDIX family)
MKLISLFEKQDTRTNKTVWGILHTPDKMLLGKRAPGTNNANQWNFFGGHVDKGESPEMALCREVFEEIRIKLKPSDLKLIGSIGDATYFSVLVKGELGKETPEISKLKFFKVTDLPDNLHNKTAQFFDRLDLLL